MQLCCHTVDVTAHENIATEAGRLPSGPWKEHEKSGHHQRCQASEGKPSAALALAEPSGGLTERPRSRRRPGSLADAQRAGA